MATLDEPKMKSKMSRVLCTCAMHVCYAWYVYKTTSERLRVLKATCLKFTQLEGGRSKIWTQVWLQSSSPFHKFRGKHTLGIKTLVIISTVKDYMRYTKVIIPFPNFTYIYRYIYIYMPPSWTPGLSSWLLALAWPRPGCHRHLGINEQRRAAEEAALTPCFLGKGRWGEGEAERSGGSAYTQLADP